MKKATKRKRPETREPFVDGSTDTPAARVRVLASGSSGNCTVVLIPTSGRPSVLLIDAGLSPRRTARLLQRMHLDLSDVRAILLTHLDHDHWHSGWRQAMPGKASVWLSERHLLHGKRHRLMPEGRATAFESDDFEFAPSVRLQIIDGSHDELGVVSFRMQFDRADGRGSGTLGFATDVGRASDRLIESLRGVEVLAIESNYCPRLQAASNRPWFLKKRIMGGSGHLSNEQSAAAAKAIAPRRHLVLLHLSRECNRPELALAAHEGAACEVHVSSQETPTSWIDVSGLDLAPVVRVPRMGEQMTMFPMGA